MTPTKSLDPSYIRGRLHSVALALLSLLAVACAPRRVPVIAPDVVFGQRDSVEQAFRIGQRDASRFEHPNRSVGDAALLLSFPASIFVARRTRNEWAVSLTWTSVGLGSTLLAMQQERKPLPLPPDSMRVHYRLDSDVMWKRYQFGYQSAVEQSRQARLERSRRHLIVGLVSALVTAAITLP